MSIAGQGGLSGAPAGADMGTEVETVPAPQTSMGATIGRAFTGMSAAEATTVLASRTAAAAIAFLHF